MHQDTNLQKVALARRAGRVSRFHTQYLMRPENIAEHTYGVMNLLVMMTGGQLTANLLINALYHDGGEYLSGDVPSPVKKRVEGLRGAINDIEDLGTQATIGDLPPLTEWEYKLLKVADNLDGMLKCIEERAMGNYTIAEGYGDGRSVGGNYCAYLETQLEELGGGPIAALVQEAITKWKWHK